MTAKHTPGPWVACFDDEDNCDGVPVRNAARGDSWVEVANVPVDYTDREEREANARLIAAAPDLLAALEGALWMIEAHEGTSDENDAIYDAALAAIAKATGAA